MLEIKLLCITVSCGLFNLNLCLKMMSPSSPKWAVKVVLFELSILGIASIITSSMSSNTLLDLTNSTSRTEKFKKTLHKVIKLEGYSAFSLSCVCQSCLKS